MKDRDKHQSDREERMQSIMGRIAFYLLAVLILGTTPYAFSQSNNASIDGEVTDPNGEQLGDVCTACGWR